MNLNLILANREWNIHGVMDGIETATWFPHMHMVICGCEDCRERMETAGQRTFPVMLPKELTMAIVC